jgi:hypothetical protein
MSLTFSSGSSFCTISPSLYHLHCLLIFWNSDSDSDSDSDSNGDTNSDQLTLCVCLCLIIRLSRRRTLR